jgi:hypothetical protein
MISGHINGFVRVAIREGRVVTATNFIFPFWFAFYDCYGNSIAG